METKGLISTRMVADGLMHAESRFYNICSQILVSTHSFISLIEELNQTENTYISNYSIGDGKLKIYGIELHADYSVPNHIIKYIFPGNKTYEHKILSDRPRLKYKDLISLIEV